MTERQFAAEVPPARGRRRGRTRVAAVVATTAAVVVSLVLARPDPDGVTRASRAHLTVRFRWRS